VRSPLYLHTLLSYRIATLANASVVVRGDLPGFRQLDGGDLTDHNAACSTLDFILINPSARTGVTNAKSKAGDLIVEPNSISLAVTETKRCDG
jgi:hypothetical protein